MNPQIGNSDNSTEYLFVASVRACAKRHMPPAENVIFHGQAKDGTGRRAKSEESSPGSHERPHQDHPPVGERTGVCVHVQRRKVTRKNCTKRWLENLAFCSHMDVSNATGS